MRFSKFPAGVTSSPVLATCSLAAVGVWTRLFDQADPSGFVRANPGDSLDEMVVALARGDASVALTAFGELVDRGVVVTEDGAVFLPQVAGLVAEASRVAGPRGGKSSTERSRARRARLRGEGATDADATTHATGCNDPCNGGATGDATGVQRAIPLHATDGNEGGALDKTTANTGDSSRSNLGAAVGATGDATDATGSYREKEREKERGPVAPVQAPLLVLESEPVKPKAPKPAKPKADPMPWTIREMLDALSERANGRVLGSDFSRHHAPPLTDVIRELHSKGYGLDDLRLTGEWIGRGGGLHFLTSGVTVSYIAKGGNVLDAIQGAKGWAANGRPSSVGGSRAAPPAPDGGPPKRPPPPPDTMPPAVVARPKFMTSLPRKEVGT